MSELHSMLRRQLRRVGVDNPAERPDRSAWSEFLDRVNASYESADDDRYRLERSLDISSREMEELHDQLREERDKLDTVLGALSDGIVYLNRDWELQFLNAAAEEMLDVSEDEAQNSSLFEFATLDLGEDELLEEPEPAIIDELREGGFLGFSDGRVQNRSGGVPADITFHPMIGEDEFRGIVLKITDITSRKRAQSRIEEARDDAQEARQARKAQAAFLANMSHELRTPLNAIIGYARLVADDARKLDYDELVPDLEKIQTAGKHLVGLISDVLDMSKIEAGRLDVDITRFDVDELVEDVTVVLAPRFEESDNELVVDCDSPLGPMRSDHGKVREILTNLLSNADKFTDDGTVRLAVSEYERNHRRWFRFEVEDTGKGIPEDEIARLFEAFTQEDESTTREHDGTGLGLAICKNFCDALDGRIGVESEVGIGTCFTVELPARTSEDATPLPDSITSSSGTDTPAATAETDEVRIDPSTVDVLLIDDEPSVHDVVTRYLADGPAALHSATTGREGLEMASRLRPDIIIVDILMPEMSGWEVVSSLNSRPATRDLPVVVGSSLEKRSKALERGADDYLTKPVDKDELTGVINKYAGDRDPTALVVEDDEVLRSLMRRRIERTNWTTVAVGDGEEAHEYLCDHRPPDLMLLDLTMPRVDGFEVLQFLNEHPRWSEIPVFIVTATELTDREQRLLEAQVDRIFYKGGRDNPDFLDDIISILEASPGRGEPAETPARTGTTE